MPGDNMDVGMQDGLAAGQTIIQADIEAVWTEIILEPLAGFTNQSPKSPLGIGREFIDAGNMLPGND